MRNSESFLKTLKREIEAKEKLVESLKNAYDHYLKNMQSELAFTEAVDIKSPMLTKDNEQFKSLSMGNKILYILKREDRFLHNNEISHFINELDPVDIPIKDLRRKVSVSCSALKSNGKLDSVTIGKNLINSFWGNPKWLDENGKIIKGHEYNKEIVKKKGESQSVFW